MIHIQFPIQFSRRALLAFPLAGIAIASFPSPAMGQVAQALVIAVTDSVQPHPSLFAARDAAMSVGVAAAAVALLLAFAAATAASREVAESWPGASRYVTPASYGAAALVGVARMYKNKHWASNVVAGAGVGTLSGVLFERYNRAYPNNAFNRAFLPASIVPERGGARVEWSVPLQ